ncbi:hypothetical protein MD484_g7460, partial [Candolleomyces efflorescens]
MNEERNEPESDDELSTSEDDIVGRGISRYILVIVSSGSTELEDVVVMLPDVDDEDGISLSLVLALALDIDIDLELELELTLELDILLVVDSETVESRKELEDRPKW